MSATDSRRDGVNRRNLLKGGAGAALLAGLGSATPAKAAGKKVVIGGFVDGALVPFKDKIIPLAQAQGFDIQFLQDQYGVTLEIQRRAERRGAIRPTCSVIGFH